MENIEFRVCKKCTVEKELCDFPKNSKTRGGFDTRCKECRNSYLKEYRETRLDRDKSNQYKSEWKKKNRGKVNIQQNRRRNERRKNDPVFKLTQIVRSRISEVCKTKCVLKTKKSMKYLGCTAKEFKEYLEKQFQPGMTWDNHTNFGWHVDHIKPLASFDLTDPKQQDIAFHYTNLQPLWWDENLRKGKQIRKESNV